MVFNSSSLHGHLISGELNGTHL